MRPIPDGTGGIDQFKCAKGNFNMNGITAVDENPDHIGFGNRISQLDEVVTGAGCFDGKRGDTI